MNYENNKSEDTLYNLRVLPKDIMVKCVVDYGLVPLTKEFLDGLDPLARGVALRGYHAWLVRARKGDKREAHKIDMRVRNFKDKGLYELYRVSMVVGGGSVSFHGYQLKDGSLSESWYFSPY